MLAVAAVTRVRPHILAALVALAVVAKARKAHQLQERAEL